MTSIRMPPGRAHVAGMATALPAITATVDEVWDALGRARGRRMPKLQGDERTRTRYFAEPLASLMERRTQSQQTDAYLDHARVLARRVCCTALERSGIAPSDLGLVIGVSCTGVVLPSLAAELIPLIGLRADVARLPITWPRCGDGGLRVILSRELPDVVEAHLRGAVDTFLEEAGLSLADIDAVAAHPGGPRIVDAMERALDLHPESLTTSRSVFAGNGNASSAGIFFVLEEMQRCGIRGRVLAIALGPGLSIELALMRLA